MIVFTLCLLWIIFSVWAMLIIVDRCVDPSNKHMFVSLCPIIHVWFCIKFTKWKKLKDIFNEDYLFDD